MCESLEITGLRERESERQTERRQSEIESFFSAEKKNVWQTFPLILKDIQV